ncbi:hypothetical protein ES703_118574 [subsurface metagenome]
MESIESPGAFLLRHVVGALIGVNKRTQSPGTSNVVLSTGSNECGPLLVSVEVDFYLAFAPPHVFAVRPESDAEVGAQESAFAFYAREDCHVTSDLGHVLTSPVGMEVEHVVGVIITQCAGDVVEEGQKLIALIRYDDAGVLLEGHGDVAVEGPTLGGGKTGILEWNHLAETMAEEVAQRGLHGRCFGAIPEHLYLDGAEHFGTSGVGGNPNAADCSWSFDVEYFESVCFLQHMDRQIQPGSIGIDGSSRSNPRSLRALSPEFSFSARTFFAVPVFIGVPPCFQACFRHEVEIGRNIGGAYALSSTRTLFGQQVGANCVHLVCIENQIRVIRLSRTASVFSLDRQTTTADNNKYSDFTQQA